MNTIFDCLVLLSIGSISNSILLLLTYLKLNSMAFRKTVKSNYVCPMHSGGFSELKSVPITDGSGVSRHVLKDVSVDELSASALPITSLTEVQRSGKVIEGSVSFAPNDPSYIDSVTEVLDGYVDSVRSSSRRAKSLKVDTPLVDTPPVDANS